MTNFNLAVDKIEYILNGVFLVNIRVYNSSENKKTTINKSHKYSFEIKGDTMTTSDDKELENCFDIFRKKKYSEKMNVEFKRKWITAKLVDELCHRLIYNNILIVYEFDKLIENKK